LPSETLRKYARQVEADEGLRPDLPTSEEREEIKALRKEVYELRRANEILKAASVLSRPSSCRRNELSRLIDEHRGRFGVEPICRTLGVSASACYSTSGLGVPCESVAALPTLPSPAMVRPVNPRATATDCCPRGRSHGKTRSDRARSTASARLCTSSFL
jgi:hypothetical protein